jgi:hypothetical protein
LKCRGELLKGVIAIAYDDHPLGWILGGAAVYRCETCCFELGFSR